MEYQEEKRAVAETMRRLYSRGLTTATGGNVSMRRGNLIFITPSSLDKSSLSADDIAVVDLDTGENLTPDKKLSIETWMHAAVYSSRRDVGAVVHSHPTFSSLYSASSDSINTHIIAEAYYLLDEVIKVPYALMGSRMLAEYVGKSVVKGSAFLLENHGALTVGKDMLSAFDRMEVLEQSAKMTYLSNGLKDRCNLDIERLAAVAAMR